MTMTIFFDEQSNNNNHTSFCQCSADVPTTLLSFTLGFVSPLAVPHVIFHTEFDSKKANNETDAESFDAEILEIVVHQFRILR